MKFPTLRAPYMTPETVFIFLLGFAIFISKPLIYLSILLLIGTAMVRMATNRDYRHTLLDSKLFWVSTGIFLLGILSAAIGSSHTEDISWMAKKTMILPMVVPLLIAFKIKENRTAAFSGILIGFWIAFVLTGHQYDWVWNGERYEGATWDVGMWGVLCAMLMAVITPMLFTHGMSWRTRALLITTFMGAGVMLVTTGSRGPLMGASAAILVYLLFQQKKHLIAVTAVTAVLFYAMSIMAPVQVNNLQQRIHSITNMESDASNYIRLALWEAGWALIKKQLSTGNISFWFGNGHEGKSDVSNEFYYSEFKHEARVKPGGLEEIGWRVNDMHNMYIESIIQNGALWTIACLAFLIYYSMLAKTHIDDKRKRSLSIPVLFCYLTIGVTYSLLPHFAFIIVLFFVTLTRSLEVNFGDH